MSMTSSVSGAEGEARAADIIDLDRYMRAAVRPSAGHRGERLVVDAGAVGRRPLPSSSSTRGSSSEVPCLPPTAHHKRFSHDSGLSDGSYVRRKLRPNRRNDAKPRESSRHSSSSIREFKAVCERAFKDQQEQISRVAELCERLAQPERDRAEAVERSERGLDESRPPERERVKQSGWSGKGQPRSESSEASSSSRSTRDPKRKNKLSSDSCKTYKIIMTKLDDLGRAFATRRQVPQPPPPRRAPPSSASVSVCDKFVATDPDTKVVRSSSPTVQTVYASAVSGGRGPRLQAARAAALDIAPAQARNNVLVHSVVRSDCTSVCSATALNQCGFDLDDPVHLYAQAKRLNPHTTHTPFERRDYEDVSEREAKAGAKRGRSLCSLCRGYWRALCQRLPNYITKDC